MKQFVARCYEEHPSDLVEIALLTPLFLAEYCPLAPVRKFFSHVDIHLSLLPNHSSDRLNNPIVTEEIAEIFMDSYNRLNLWSPTLCDPKRRQIAQSQATLIDLTQTTAVVQIRLLDICQECPDLPELFDDEDFVFPGGAGSLKAAGCLCQRNQVFVPRSDVECLYQRVPTSDRRYLLGLPCQFDGSVTSRWTEATRTLVLQAHQSTSFQSSLAISYQLEHGSTLLMSDIALFADAMQYTYNRMLETDYFDPLCRQISNVAYTLSEYEASTKVATVEFTIAGTCHGCESDSPLYHDINLLKSSGIMGFADRPHSKGQRVHLDDFSSPCRGQARTNRPPTEQEFLQAYKRALSRYSNVIVAITNLCRDIPM